MTKPDASLLVSPVTIGGRSRAIVRRAGTDAAPILRVEGVGTREQAEALRGEPVWVERGAAPPLEPDEYYAADLVGCAVVDGERAVGVVERVLAYPSCELLVVGELLVPLVHDAVRNVDLQARRIEVDLEFLGAG